MLSTIVNAVEPIVVSAAVAVITTLIGVVGTAATKWLSAKKQAVEKQIGTTEYNQLLSYAHIAWGIVEEEFRTHPELEKTMEAKQAQFAEWLEKLVPGLTTEKIEALRQAVAAEVNKGKAALTTEDVQKRSTAAEQTASQSITVNVSAPANATPEAVAQQVTAAVQQAQITSTQQVSNTTAVNAGA